MDALKGPCRDEDSVTDLGAATPSYAVLAGPSSRSRDRASIRRTNLGVVLRTLRDAGPRSRAQIATETGLPKPTVTSLVALGLVREGPAQREGAVGRPGTLVPGCIGSDLQLPQHGGPGAIDLPPLEDRVRGLPRPVPLRQVPPR